jgi:hypothetical protein
VTIVEAVTYCLSPMKDETKRKGRREKKIRKRRAVIEV